MDLGKKNGYEYKPYRCHYTAKVISLLDGQFKYYTGFIHKPNHLPEYIMHSFNVFNNEIVDFSRKEHEFSHFDFPQIYSGTNIPIEFLKIYNNDSIFKKEDMKPLLIEWYKESLNNI